MNEIIKSINFSTQLKNIISVFQGSSGQDLRGEASLEYHTLEERASQRVRNEDILHQKNIEDVVKGATERLAHEEGNTQTQPVDEDWLRQFKNKVQDISEKEMKLIWSKVLADEIKSPKSYSLRTLHVLSNLSKDDASIITKVAPFILADDSGKRVIIHERHKDSDMLDFEDLLFLSELGLLETSSILAMSWKFENTASDYSNCIKLKNNTIGINIYTSEKEYVLPTYSATVIGNQIFSLIEGVEPNIEYYQSVLEKLLIDCRCTCGQISEEGGDNGFVFSEEIFRIDKILNREKNNKSF